MTRPKAQTVMANHQELAPFVLAWEGGFANVPGDRGGATNMGVTIATWQAYCRGRGLAGTVDTLRRMTRAQWTDIFKQMFWDRWQADRLQDQSLANLLVDWTWASGSHGIRKPQALLGVAADGVVGPKTLAALHARPARELFAELHALRVKFVQDIVKRNPSQQKFLRGWLRRINSIRYGELLRP